MAYTKNIQDADTYFNPDNHLSGDEWKSYDIQDRTAALAESQREIELSEGRAMVDPPSGWTSGCRDDYAVFEQALYLLQYKPRTTENNAVDLIARVKDDKSDDPGDVGISAIAQRWLSISRIQMVRG